MNTYLITGASSDVSIELLNRLEESKEECVAICQYRSNKAILDQCREKFKFVQLKDYRCDLSNYAEIEQWINEVQKDNYHPTHIAHFAASRLEYNRIKDFDWETLDREFLIQVGSLGMILKAFLPGMAKKKYGKIAVMLTSCTLGTPPKFMSNYYVPKYALMGLVRAAASEYAGKGITINALSPNMMETKFLENLDERVIEMTANQTSMKRNIKVSETVDSVMFLLSEHSNYMNGINLNLSGGDYM